MNKTIDATRYLINNGICIFAQFDTDQLDMKKICNTITDTRPPYAGYTSTPSSALKMEQMQYAKL
jgi:hypothetical protein